MGINIVLDVIISRSTSGWLSFASACLSYPQLRIATFTAITRSCWRRSSSSHQDCGVKRRLVGFDGQRLLDALVLIGQ